MQCTLDRNGHFYRGTLHIHTTESDGELTPEEVRDLYERNGYAFIAVTDHNRYGVYKELSKPGFLVLPGTELNCVHQGQIHHIVGIGTPDGPGFPHGYRFEDLQEKDPQELVDTLTKQGCIAIYAHPFWSYCDPEILLKLRGLTGMEIINYSCEQEWKSGISEYYFEYVRSHGSGLWCFGADDAHGHVPDFLGGYITVKAPELTWEAIIGAIRRGSFYASFAREGEKAPEIFDFVVEDGVAKIDCSPVRNIHINVSQSCYCPVHGTEDNPVTHHEFRLPEDARQVRAIVSDFRGLVSWTQPIVL
ncbi:MAG: hypothetical protein II781_00985 [Clostridia bacterium]|nr:hypothetical protein [Clostridia bacterium]